MSVEFFKNPFLAQCFSFLCIFFLGLAFSCLLKIILPSKKSRVKSKKFSKFCVFLTFFVIFYTILIFSEKSIFWFADFSKIYHHYYIILCLIFVFGVIVSFFWKIAVPVSLVLYISLTIFTNHILFVNFGEQKQKIPIRIDEKSQKTLSLVSCRLPEMLVLPLRRNWFCVGENSLKAENQKNESFLLSNPIVRFYTEKILLKNLSSPQNFPIPETNIFPSLYSAKISFKNEKIKCDFERDL